MVVITLSSNTSELHETLSEILELPGDRAYEIGLINLWTFNSIPNIIKGENSSFKYGDNLIKLDTGSYEIDNIIEAIKRKLNISEQSEELQIKGNNNTLQTEIYANKPIDLTQVDSIAPILGFNKSILKPYVWHYSTNPVSISNVTSIIVSCNLASNTYANGKETHTIYEFLPKVPPGYLINETPNPIIYVSLNTNKFQTIIVKVTDQKGSLLDFRGDRITVRIHIREKK